MPEPRYTLTSRVTDLRTGIVRDAHPARDWKRCAELMRDMDLDRAFDDLYEMNEAARRHGRVR